MEKNKNKKKLFAIIGASALAFVLTIALSVSITLAYFGQSAQGGAKIATSGSVLVDTAAKSTTDPVKYVPGQKYSIDVEANVTSSSSQTAYLFALVKANVTPAKDGVVDSLVTGNLAENWTDTTKAAGEYTVYLYGTATLGKTINATTADQKIKLINTADATVPTTWDNGYADLTIDLDVIFVAVQSPVKTDNSLYVSDDAPLADLMIIANAILKASSDATINKLVIA